MTARKMNTDLEDYVRDLRFFMHRILTPVHEMGEVRLNFGSGRRLMPGFLNADKYPADGVDLYLDFEKPIWYWIPNNTFTFIYFGNVLEHVPHRCNFIDGELWFPLINELLRVSKDGALWEVSSPHWASPDAMDSAGHCRVVNLNSFTPWNDERPDPAFSEEINTIVRSKKERLEVIRHEVSRGFQLGPLSDYHARKYLRLEVGRPRKVHLVLRVVKK